MKLTIYRGTNEIGGSCIELEQDNTRILFDFGIPLEAMDVKGFKIENYKPNIKNHYDAVFITHAHPDHYGLLELLDDNTPIYATADTCEILKNITPLTTKFQTENLNFIPLDETVEIGKFKITPHEIDHSIVGACALKISCYGKTILYTGDIRFHGRCAYKNSVLTKCIEQVDYLIMEGTTINRSNQEKVLEDDLIPLFVKEFEKDKLSLVIFSPQNLDRFITVYKACLQTKKTLVIDPYTCYILELYKRYHKNIPQYNWDNIRVYFASNSITSNLAESKKLYKYKTKKISIDEIKANKSKYVIKGNHIINEKLFAEFKKEDLNIIFSMWKGYLNKPCSLDDYKDVITHIHTSGHATIKDLQKLVKDIEPKTIIPIHTECKEQYKELFEAPVLEVQDGITLDLQGGAI